MQGQPISRSDKIVYFRFVVSKSVWIVDGVTSARNYKKLSFKSEYSD